MTLTENEIADLTRVARPDIAIITTVSETHLEGLGSLAGVLKEKLAIFTNLPSDGVALVGERPQDLLRAARERVPGVGVAGFGPGSSEELRPVDAVERADGCWSFVWRGAAVTLRIAGRHAVTNALLALAAAEALGVDPERAARGVSTTEPQPLRGERRDVGALTLFLDCYNANPESTLAALGVLHALGGDHRPTVAFLGSMLELGERAAELHRAVLAEAVRVSTRSIVIMEDTPRSRLNHLTVVLWDLFTNLPAMLIPPGMKMTLGFIQASRWNFTGTSNLLEKHRCVWFSIPARVMETARRRHDTTIACASYVGWSIT